MDGNINLIVMLTYADQTVKNAYEIFEQCKHTEAQYWGMKEKGISRKQMKDLFSYMKNCGKTTVLEVVAYTEKECIEGARIAAECNCDILMGTVFFDSVNEYCKENNLRYIPFVGNVKNRPSVLSGTVEEMAYEAKEYLKKGAFGVDLLGYRYAGDREELIRKFTAMVNAPVCIAGSVNSFEKIDAVIESGVWAFTIGGAFFENKFGPDFARQISSVYEYVQKSLKRGKCDAEAVLSV